MAASGGYVLYGTAWSSCTGRVRIALNLKGIKYRSITDVSRTSKEYAELNPQALVPLLITPDARLSQSVAILEYLEEQQPTHSPLLPTDPDGRARVRSIAQFVVSEMQPLQNTRLDKELTKLGVHLLAWRQTWIKKGFDVLEGMLKSDKTGKYCHGDSPTMADCCLVPQAMNAGRYELDMATWPRCNAVVQHCIQLPAFEKALPQNQPDFEK
ncbi:hypothetical protein WJX73_003054 [Symbiochloris irregularis]|uniref:Maleylacetoacetate isomerase n=1 Tax=Symbiochloris irregularis TaxID=706552 RepID=A0AAW1PRY7_9CHLO